MKTLTPKTEVCVCLLLLSLPGPLPKTHVYFKTFYYMNSLFLCMCVSVQASVHMWQSEDSLYEMPSPSTTWVLGTDLRPVASALTH